MSAYATPAHGQFRRWLVVVYETVFGLVFALPRFRVCDRVKAALLRMCGASVGRRVVFYPGIWIVPPTGLRLGDDVDLARGVIITAGDTVEIGNRTLVGYRCNILSSNHRVPPADGRIFDAGHVRSPVVIEADCWLGANCTVLPGVTIGAGAVVAAGAVVTRDIPPGAIVAGTPARVVRMRGDAPAIAGDTTQ